MHACKCNVHKCAGIFLNLVIALKNAEFGGDEEKECCSERSDVYSQLE